MVFFRHETNGRIQGVFALIAIALSVYYKLPANEWLWIIACISLVIALEMVNSSIEKVCNIISSEYHPTIKVIKDMCAGAVLWASVFSAVIGCIIFLPKILHSFS